MKRKTYTITGNGGQTVAYAWNTALKASAKLLPPASGKWQRLGISYNTTKTDGAVEWENLSTGQRITLSIKQEA